MAAVRLVFSFLLMAFCLSPQVELASLNNDIGPIIKNNLHIGSVQPGDRLLLSQMVIVQAKPGEVVTDNVFFAGCLVRLNHITAYNMQITSGATVELIAGGIGENIAFLSFSSAVGGKLWYMVNMYGH